MIPVAPQLEPPDFHETVRLKGQAFLRDVPNPTSKQFETKAFWRGKCLDDLYESHGGICAYSAQWIPRGEGTPTVDHYLPKAKRPDLAYEWDNYRLACGRCNGVKREFEDVLDPFRLEPETFFLDFPSLFIRPNPAFPDLIRQEVQATLMRLKLNTDLKCLRGRKAWLEQYCQGKFTFEYLREKVPFIAYELERQELVDGIAGMMDFPGR